MCNYIFKSNPFFYKVTALVKEREIIQKKEEGGSGISIEWSLEILRLGSLFRGWWYEKDLKSLSFFILSSSTSISFYILYIIVFRF